MSIDVLGKKLLFLTAHPDDESFLASATMLANHRQGGRSYIICATFGEQGKSQLAHSVSPAQLKRIRQAELRQVSKKLKVAKLFTLGLPDGELKRHESVILSRCRTIARTLKPNYIVSFGPDGISRHLDHIAIGRVARRLADELVLPFLAFARPPKIAYREEFYRSLRRHGVYARTLGYTKPNLKILADPKRKLAVIRLHKSQLKQARPLPSMPAYALREILSAEYFVCPPK